MTREFDLIRSWLFVPGDSPGKLEKCWTVGADAVVVDLEDAVGPANKEAARQIAAEVLAAADRRGTTAFIRLGASFGEQAIADIEATLRARPDGYVLPKVEDAAQIVTIARALDGLEERYALQRGTIRLIPIVTETPRAVQRLEELCLAHRRNAAVIWGSEDLSAELGSRRVKGPDGTMLDVFRVVRALTLIAASGAGLPAIDTPVVELSDLDRLRAECEEAAASGFTGKLAMHPAQVPVINAGFLPSRQEVEHARALLDRGRAQDGGVFRFGDQMVDLPHFKRAERLTRLHDAHQEPD